MKKRQKFLVPIYGLQKSLKTEINLNSNLLLRNIDLIGKEYELFEKYGLKGTYNAVLEVNYEYDLEDASEPLPGIYLNIVNKFDASLVVFGDGKVGVAAVFPDTKDDNFPGGGISFSGKVHYDECLDKEIDEEFKVYYEKFSKAYDMRPVAFDIFRRSQDRFSNNDKTIDNCTVLESIFVPVSEKVKKPFILNGMKIMGFYTKEIDLINALIDYRNAIIHADRAKQLQLLSGKKYTFSWFEDTFKLIRRILYKYVESPWD